MSRECKFTRAYMHFPTNDTTKIVIIECLEKGINLHFNSNRTTSIDVENKLTFSWSAISLLAENVSLLECYAQHSELSEVISKSTCDVRLLGNMHLDLLENNAAFLSFTTVFLYSVQH